MQTGVTINQKYRNRTHSIFGVRSGFSKENPANNSPVCGPSHPFYSALKIFHLMVILYFCAVFLPCSFGEEGIASFYGLNALREHLNPRTANNELFNPHAFTAASYAFPLNSKVRCHYQEKSVVVRINDRGPAKRLHRLIDFTPVAFKRLSPLHQGLIPVNCEVL